MSRLRSSMSVFEASTPSSHAASPSSVCTCRSGGELSRVNHSQSFDFGRCSPARGEIAFGVRQPIAARSCLLFRRGVGQNVLPVPRRGVEVAAHVDQRAVRLGRQPVLEPLADLSAGRLEIVGEPDDAVGPLLQPRREHVPGEDAMAGLLEHLAQHGRAVDAGRGPGPLPLAVDRVDVAGTAGRRRRRGTVESGERASDRA